MTLYGPDLAYVHAAGFEPWVTRAAPRILRVLRRRGLRPRSRVVDLGCGSGLWVRALARAGHDALGIDASPAMVALARRRVPGAVFRRGLAARATLPPCDAVTAFGECFNYVPRGARAPSLPRVFRRIHRALRPGGLFLFDVRLPSPSPVRSRLVHALGADWAVLARVVERGGFLTRHLTTFRRVGRAYRRGVEVHRQRLYPRREVVRALREAGFALTVLPALGGVPLGAGRIAFLARRRADAAGRKG